MADFNRELVLISALTFALFLFSIAMSIVGGLPPVSSLFWTSVSVLHVDYDILSLSSASNPFLLVADVCDAIIFTLLAFVLATASYESIMNLRIEERLVESRIKRLRGHLILVPLNPFSEALARELEKEGLRYVIIKADESEHPHISRRSGLSIYGNPRFVETYTSAGIANARSVIACSDSDIENAMIALTAKAARKEINVIARASKLETIPNLNKAGATRIVLPEVSAGTRIGEAIARKFLD